MSQTGPFTFFGPPERASDDDVLSAARTVEQWPIVRNVLDAVPGPAIVLNLQRQIIAANRRFLEITQADAEEQLLGLRVGETLRCRQVSAAPSGCGTSLACQYCGFMNTVLEALAKKDLVAGECRILTENGDAIELEMAVTRHVFDDMTVLFVGMRDLGAQKRREVLEHTFFHDILNTVNGIRGLLSMMTFEPTTKNDGSSVGRVLKLVDMLVDEIQGQWQLLAAEKNELTTKSQPFDLMELIRSMVDIYTKQPLGRNKQIVLGETANALMMCTDPTLLLRVVGNLIKNALEATKPGGQIGIAVRADRDHAVITVHSDAVMDESTRSQIFQRSFSTRGTGRGIGLYSVQLFTERYLGGKVAFRSAAEEGTLFEVRIPLLLPI